MLAASGELDLTMDGKPADLLDAGNKRRTVYALVDRQFLAGAFRTFDFANPDIHGQCVTRRPFHSRRSFS